jgi:hypothetical protein
MLLLGCPTRASSRGLSIESPLQSYAERGARRGQEPTGGSAVGAGQQITAAISPVGGGCAHVRWTPPLAPRSPASRPARRVERKNGWRLAADAGATTPGSSQTLGPVRLGGQSGTRPPARPGPAELGDFRHPGRRRGRSSLAGAASGRGWRDPTVPAPLDNRHVGGFFRTASLIGYAGADALSCFLLWSR